MSAEGVGGDQSAERTDWRVAIGDRINSLLTFPLKRMPHFYEFNSVLTGDHTLQVLCSTVALVSLAAPVSLATPEGAPETIFRTDSLKRLQE